ncbi:MaoC family dehydratase [Amycolatopsis cynarae]|uniref:MaoC family dehydratase n=1 Tax=Amycolatopsis cynarae TaxID=2995223 RepID=A0ABY7BBF0_9PSEU|nr:MaoC family dehydratase [Amycolatopsis sp. HUAS 11-8]WAL69471.1 MaoC family dehydratase [Amycolatopsis sp. HUAS 11-8]
MRVFNGLEEFAGAVGEHLGYSEWYTVTQEQVNTFADATDDHQWIHVDVEKAKQGPFGAPIAHGFLTLSLIPALAARTYRVENLTMGINYGLNKVRFPSPVKVGSRIRGGGELLELTDVPGGKQAVTRWTIEIEGETKPACIAEFVTRMLG